MFNLSNLMVRSLCAAILLCAFGYTIQAAPGDLDPTFGNSGIVTTILPGNFTGANNFALQADGKIIGGGGNTYSGDQQQPFVARYNADGSLDTTFGTGGTVKTQTNTGLFQNNLNGNTLIRSLQVASDGTIYAIGGGAFNPNSTDTSFNPIILKYSASGGFIALNRNIVVVPASIQRAANFGAASVLQPDGKLIFANVGGFINNFIKTHKKTSAFMRRMNCVHRANAFKFALQPML